METQKDFDTLNANELLNEANNLLLKKDFEDFSNIMFELARKYNDKNKLISYDLFRHINNQLYLGGYQQTPTTEIYVSFKKQYNGRFLMASIWRRTATTSVYRISNIEDIKEEHFKGRLDTEYSLEDLYNKRFSL